MQIILLDKVVNLGNLGEVVKVKDGYARNFLIPSGRARRATRKADQTSEEFSPSSVTVLCAGVPRSASRSGPRP